MEGSPNYHLSTHHTFFNKLYIDIMYMPKAQGFKYIVATRDDLTGVCEAQP
jgi:hypothetical protein